MFYFYYPAELESSLGPATLYVKSNEQQTSQAELLRELNLKSSLDKAYLFYPTIDSVISQCVLDEHVRSVIISSYEKLSKQILDLKSAHQSTLVCIGVSVIGQDEIETGIEDIAYKVSFNFENKSLNGMLAEYYVSKTKNLKRLAGRLSAISQFVEEPQISESAIQTQLSFISEALLIKSNYGNQSDIQSTLKLLEEEKERAVHQIQILQENLVEKHQESSLRESKIENKYLDQINELNKENDKLLSTLQEFEEQSTIGKKTLDKSIKEIQKLQEHYENKCLEANETKALSVELKKENNVLAAQILDANKEQMNLSLMCNSLTEQVERDKKQAIGKQKVIERELTRLKTRNAEITHKYSALRYQMFCNKRELEIIHSSPFWKGSRLLKNLKSKLNRNRISESVKADIALIATSEYFDFDWYLETYNDVQEANVDPAQHYLIAGAEEGRLPGPNFDGNWYLERYPDVAEAQLNPLLHFIKCGKREGRVPSPKMLADKRSN